MDDEAEPIVAQRQAPVLRYPGIAVLHRPAPLPKPDSRSHPRVWVDAGLSAPKLRPRARLALFVPCPLAQQHQPAMAPSATQGTRSRPEKPGKRPRMFRSPDLTPLPLRLEVVHVVFRDDIVGRLQRHEGRQLLLRHEDRRLVTVDAINDQPHCRRAFA